MNRFKQVISKYYADFFIIIGLIVVIFATFLLNFIAGLYVTSVVFLILGVYFSFPYRGK